MIIFNVNVGPDEEEEWFEIEEPVDDPYAIPVEVPEEVPA